MNYYNEFDKGKAAWLRENIRRGLIALGDVDERSIADVRPGDLAGYRQCHFFAGIGVWSYALRLAGWSDDRPVWTASCPCQPFSTAGKRKGTADERHLWPVLAELIKQLRPVVLIGEQVAGPDGLAWLDLVCDDLERCAYTPGAVISPACGYGAPHRRERLYWCALDDADQKRCADNGQEKSIPNRRGVTSRLAQPAGDGREQWRAESGGRSAPAGCGPMRLADSRGTGLEERASIGGDARAQCAAAERDRGTGGLANSAGAGPLSGTLAGVRSGKDGRGARHGESERSRHAGSLEHGDGERLPRGMQRDGEPEPGGETGGERLDAGGSRAVDLFPGAVRGAWAGADWVLARPQRVGDPPSLRPVEPGTFPLADGAPARVLRLRGYGDAIAAPQAAAFIEAVMEEL